MSEPTRRILVSSHGEHIHLLSLPPSPSTDLQLVSTLKLGQQPSYSLPHPTITGLIYVSAWIPDIIYAVKLNGDQMEMVSQTSAGAGGPTFFILTEDKASLLIANYRSGTLTRVALDPSTGLFLHSSPPARDILQLPQPSSSLKGTRPNRFEVRQDGPHAHQIITLPSTSGRGSQEYLACDLGSDKVYVVTSTENGGWGIVSTYETTPRYGPRHAVIRPSQNQTPALVYIVNELASVVTTHHILSNPTRLSDPIFSPVSTLPKSITEGYTPEGPMETIACAILLLHHTGSQDELIVTNRNLPLSVSTQQDPWTSFPVLPTGELGTPEFHFGAGRHLRGIGYDTRDRRLLVASREGDGFALYKKHGAGWEELGTGLLADEKRIEFPLAIDWL